MLLKNLKTRKTKHVNKIKDHIFAMHMLLSRKAQDLDELNGKELNKKVKELQSISSRMKQYQRYLKLLMF